MRRHQLFMCTPQEFEQNVALSATLLQSQNAKTIQRLKDLLTFTRSPTRIREVLTAAIERLIASSPETICWLLANSDALQPEVNVTEVVTWKLIQTLLAQGYLPEEDFQIDSFGQLQLQSHLQTTVVNSSLTSCDPAYRSTCQVLYLITQAIGTPSKSK